MDTWKLFTFYLYLFMLSNTTATVDILNHRGKGKNIKYTCNVSIFLCVINNCCLVSRNTWSINFFFLLLLSDKTLGVLTHYWILNLSFADTGMQIKKTVLSLVFLTVNGSLNYELTSRENQIGKHTPSEWRAWN